MMALPTPDPSSALCVTMFLPFSPKMSTRASCNRLAKLGYFCCQRGYKGMLASSQPTSFCRYKPDTKLTLYSEPSAPTAHPSSR